MGSLSTPTSSVMSRAPAPRLATMSLSAASWIFFPLQIPLTSINARDSNLKLPLQICFSACASWLDGTAVRKPSPPMLMPRMGVGEPAMSRAARSIVPSPPKTRSKSDSRASVAMSPSTTALRPVLWMSRAALRMIAAHEALSEFPMRPMRFILSACFFNQHQKFFVSRRAEQRRFRHAAPVQIILSGDKCFQFLQHALMHGGIRDHAPAFVRLGLARLELRFDERDNFAVWFQ